MPSSNIHFGGTPRRVLFDVGDQVSFRDRSRVYHRGTITKLNPKRAKIDCGSTIWNVPYQYLLHTCNAINSERSERLDRLTEVAAEARRLMDQHGLPNWLLGFNHSFKQLGLCNYEKKEILLSAMQAIRRTPAETTDVILHEIAHALAGWKAGHGPKWKKIATRIGAKPNACAEAPTEIMERHLAVKNEVQVGDTVTFKNKQQQTIRGVVIRKNPKTVTVKVPGGTWRVSYFALETS